MENLFFVLSNVKQDFYYVGLQEHCTGDYKVHFVSRDPEEVVIRAYELNQKKRPYLRKFEDL